MATTTDIHVDGPADGEMARSVADRDELAAVADRLVEQARADGVALTGDGGLLTGLVQQVLQTALETELTDHLGYEPHAMAGRGSGNSRNGYYPKTVRTEVGDVRLDVPRDRNGSFEPATVPVGQRRLAGLDQAIISLYAKGPDHGRHCRSLGGCDRATDRSFHDLASDRCHCRRHGGMAIQTP